MPACDACRKRKIRCDRELPCGACRSSNFECSITLRGRHKTDSTSRRTPVPLSSIKPKTISEVSIPCSSDEPGTAATVTLRSASVMPPTQQEPDASDSISSCGLETVEFEGETSAHAHSVVAQDLLVQTLNDHSYVRDNPKMVAALNCLRQLVETNQIEPSPSQLRLKGLDRATQSIYELKLPPSDIISDVIRQSKERTTFLFESPLAFITRDQFYKLSKTVFFRTEDYPTSTAIIVYGTLENLLHEFEWSEKDQSLRKQYSELARLCRTNLEVGIANLNLLLPATMEGVQAIAVAASHCLQIGQASISKKLVTHGYMMVQSLGWHRSASMKNDKELIRRQKLLMFWMFYTIDNNLSLRLGQASSIQEYEIDLPLPWADPSAPLPSLGRIKLWANTARVMGLIYQQLYSPGALKQTDAARSQAVQQLLRQVESIRPKAPDRHDISQFIDAPEGNLAEYFYDTGEVVVKSDEIKYYALLCMIYRAAPMSAGALYDPAVECVNYARAALNCHKECTAMFKGRAELWALYLHWTLLSTPLVAFTTLFSHVLATHNLTDLEALRHFAESLSDCPAGQPAHKISQLASVFFNIATLYVETREQDFRNACAELRELPSHGSRDDIGADLYQETTTYPLPTKMPFSPFLDALGLVDDSSFNRDGALNANASLESWFNGNQHITGLLENDLSYLDSAATMF